MFTSFANEFDRAGYHPATTAHALTYARSLAATHPSTWHPSNDAAIPTPAHSKGLKSSFATATKEERRRNGASEDGQIGSMVLDTFFNIAFPGLGLLFNPLGALDMVEAYDQTRTAFRRATRPGVQAYQTPAAMANARRRQMMAPPPMPIRRKTSLLAFMFG